jgi:hypothetical protein
LTAFATLILDGYAAGAPCWQQAVAVLRHDTFSSRDLGWLVLGTDLAVTRWDEAAWDELSQRDLRLARETGAMDVLPIVLTNRACAHVLAGAYGEWLRREGRRIDARQQLRTSRGLFGAIGAVALPIARHESSPPPARPSGNGRATMVSAAI